MVWETGKLPDAWKHRVVMPIAKPGKDQSQTINYGLWTNISDFQYLQTYGMNCYE